MLKKECHGKERSVNDPAQRKTDCKTTGELLHILTSTHSAKELDTYLETHTYPEDAVDFASFFQHFLDLHHLKRSDVIRAAQLDRTYGYQIFNGSRRPSRDKIMALCIAARLSLRETQRCLEIAGEGILYARSSRDAVIIYGIEHHMDVMQINELLADKRERILE